MSTERGMDLINALSSAPSGGAPLIYTGGDTPAELLRDAPVTAHDSLYIARVITSRAGIQLPVVRSITRTAAGVAGDTDLTDTDATSYGGGIDGTGAQVDAAGSLALFAQVRSNSTSGYTPGSLGVEVYALLVEIQAAQNVALPAIDFDILGCSMGASSYNSSATGVAPGATWSYANATNSNIRISGSISPPSSVSQQFRQRVRFLVLPAVAYNGLYYYTPFVCRPTGNLTNLTGPVVQQQPTAFFPGRAVIHCRLNNGIALPTGTTVNYQLLTRGQPDVDKLIQRYTQNERALGKFASNIK